MPAYQQMGHHSTNLHLAPDCGDFAGLILSPVNYSESDLQDHVQECAETRELIFDPQLYFPRTQQGDLPSWSYFPTDVDTADTSNLAWWDTIVQEVLAVCARLGVTRICAPALVPRVYDEAYYELTSQICEIAIDRAGDAVEVLPTVLAKMDDLSAEGRREMIASIASRVPEHVHRAYLVFVSSVETRRELREADDLIGAMRLIRELRTAGLSPLIAFSSSDLALWKAADAESCATGKFFNLRRFTPTRFAPPPGGGGQVSYWFEESLMAFLRTADLQRIRQRSLLSASSLANPAGQRILQKIDAAAGEAWVGDSWRQYLWWFQDFDRRVHGNRDAIDVVLENAQQNWATLRQHNVFMDEPANDGGWLPIWRQVIASA